jgi:hypothetical protein
MVSRDAAYESAARNAVLSLQPGLRTDKVWYGMVWYGMVWYGIKNKIKIK